MTAKTSERDPVEALAESFVERLRRGEHPSVTEYTEKYPELADGIRDLFPTLAMVERLGPAPVKEAGESGRLTDDRVPLRQLGEYRIIREIGHGGMGVVYEAEQESLGRHVALKVLPAHAAADPTHLKRFHREARAAARLHHSNIVPVFDVGEHQGIHYYAMQCIQGQGLDVVFGELRRLRGYDKPQPADVGTETFHERAARSELANTIVRGLVSGHFIRAESFTTERDCGALALPGSDRAGASPSVSATAADSFNREPQATAPARHAPDLPVVTSDAVACGSRLNEDATDLNPWERSGTINRSGSTGTGSSVVLRGQLADASETHAHYFQSVARIALQVAEALEYAHGQGLLHRDIKPSNLILDTAGVIWVTDFGLAKNEGDNLTHTGDVVGTLRYMAPERFRGRADVRSDVYSLGLTLYEFLTLRPDDRYVAARYEHNSLATLYVWDLARWAGFQPANSSGDQRQAGSLLHVMNSDDAVILKVEAVARANAIDFSPDNRLVAIGRYDHSISIFNLEDRQEQTRFPPGPPPTRLRFDPSGNKLAISNVDGQTVQGRKVYEVQIRHLETGKVETLRHPDGVRGIAWHPDGKVDWSVPEQGADLVQRSRGG